MTREKKKQWGWGRGQKQGFLRVCVVAHLGIFLGVPPNAIKRVVPNRFRYQSNGVLVVDISYILGSKFYIRFSLNTNLIIPNLYFVFF